MKTDSRIIACIEARMGSMRLPGKVLKKVIEKPLLQLMIERLKESKEIDDIVVATTTNESDLPIVNLCKELNVKFFRGSEEDVLSRVVKAIESVRGDIIVELTGDCPLIDPFLIDEMIKIYKKNNYDYYSNCHPYTYPEGFDIIIFSLASLKWVDKNISDPAVREHVSLYFHENPQSYKIGNYVADRKLDRPKWHLSVDEIDDFKLISKIFENLYNQSKIFTVKDVIIFLDNNPDILKINRNVKFKEASV